MSKLTLAAVQGESGLQVQIHLDEPPAGGALLLSVTGTAGRLLAQERLLLPEGVTTLDHLIRLDETPLRLKGVLLVEDEVVAQDRLDLHICFAVFES